MKNFQFMIQNARTQLTCLGMSMFYLYLILALICCFGLIYGITTLVLKITHIGTAANASLWQVTCFIFASWFMMKLFLRESKNLINDNNSPNNNEDIKSRQSSSQPNVIPFKRKSKWIN